MLSARGFIISLYIIFIYWLSLQFTSLHMMFFPTLGAYCLFFMTKPLSRKAQIQISFGSVMVSILSTLMYHWNTGIISLFITTLITIGLINYFKWNAPPVLAVSIIPFFTHSASYWEFPVAISLSLSGIVVLLVAADFFVNKKPVINRLLIKSIKGMKFGQRV